MKINYGEENSAGGKIINVIPAVSDADPGYHTNLSLPDAMTGAAD